jgi:hypothetical protein
MRSASWSRRRPCLSIPRPTRASSALPSGWFPPPTIVVPAERAARLATVHATAASVDLPLVRPVPGAGKTSTAGVLERRGRQAVCEYVSECPGVENDDAHQRNWVAKTAIAVPASTAGDVFCDRDVVTALAFAYSIDDRDLLAQRQPWPRHTWPPAAWWSATPTSCSMSRRAARPPRCAWRRGAARAPPARLGTGGLGPRPASRSVPAVGQPGVPDRWRSPIVVAAASTARPQRASARKCAAIRYQ